MAETQPVKLAAMEGQFATERHAPLRIGGFPDEATESTKWAIEIPGGLSWIAYGDRNAKVMGLRDVPKNDRPPVAVVHFAFQTMVGIGMFLIVLSFWVLACLVRHRRLPASWLFFNVVVASGPLSIIAMETGWIVTEVGRQPWIVQGHMRTAEAVTSAPGITWVFVVTLAIYGVLAIGCLGVLRALGRKPVSLAQTEAVDAA